MYYTGIHPFTKKKVYVAKQLRDRKMQRALLQFFKPENYFEVRAALLEAKRGDLIGDGCDSLIPARAPKEALERRRNDASARFRGEYVHTIPGPGEKSGGGSPGGKPKFGPAAGPLKKGKKKQSRHAPGKGYRPDAKKGRMGE
jgi:hypothetical protein